MNGAIARAADTASWRPAALTEKPKSLQRRIRFPDVEGDVFVRLDCDASVAFKGYFRRSFCFAPDNSVVRFEIAVTDAARRAVIAPALVDGVAREAGFQFRVEFERRGVQQAIRVYPNHGLQANTFGVDYSSPQRLGNWDRDVFARNCPPRTRLWVAATVSEQGTPEGVAVEPGGIGGTECRAYLVESFLKTRFIPAFSGGRPVRAQYREMFFFYGFSARQIGALPPQY